MIRSATRERAADAPAWHWHWEAVPLEWGMCAVALLIAAGLKLSGLMG